MNTLHFVIDGTNVVLLHGRANPELRYVIALFNHLRSQGHAVDCFFDANTAYVLKEHSEEQFKAFETLLVDQRWSGFLHVVPSGTEADESILSFAKTKGADVISNDKYRSRARDHRWIWRRRHPLIGTRDCLILETLDLRIPVLPTAGEYL